MTEAAHGLGTVSAGLITGIRRLAMEEIDRDGKPSEIARLACLLAMRHEILLGCVLGREAAIHAEAKMREAELAEAEVRG